MLKNIWSKIVLTALFAVSSCQGGNFSGDSGQVIGARNPDRKRPNDKLPPCEKDKTKNCKKNDDGDHQPPTPDGPLLSTDGGGVCLNRVPTIDFVFAMDVSGTMQEESDRVNAAFLELASNLSNISIPELGKVEKVRFGLVTYEDSIIYQAALSDKVDIVKSNISTNFHAVERWSDFSEAGFFAAKTALNLAKDGDTVKVLFLATDAYSHDGGGIDGNRTYDSSALVQTFAAPNMKMSFLFTATDPRGGSGNIFNIPSGTAQAQWDQVRSKAGVKGKDYDIAGFSTSTVSEDIPKAIAAGLHKCK